MRRFSEILEEYLSHRDVVVHVFSSSEIRGDRMVQKKFHKQKMEELAQIMDTLVPHEPR